MTLPFFWIDILYLPELAVVWFPSGLGLAVVDEPTELSCVCAPDTTNPVLLL